MTNKLEFEFTKDFKLVIDFLNLNFSSPTHYPDWNNVISDYYSTEFMYQLCIKNGNLIGICPYHKFKNHLLYEYFTGPQIYLIPYGGWIFNEHTTLNLKESNKKNLETNSCVR